MVFSTLASASLLILFVIYHRQRSHVLCFLDKFGKLKQGPEKPLLNRTSAGFA